MVALENRLCRRDEDVIAKVMDGEAVIINLANGTYLSAMMLAVPSRCSTRERPELRYWQAFSETDRS